MFKAVTGFMLFIYQNYSPFHYILKVMIPYLFKTEFKTCRNSSVIVLLYISSSIKERTGLTRDRVVVGSDLTGGTALCH